MRTEKEIRKEIERLKRKIVKTLKCPNEYDPLVRDLKIHIKVLAWVSEIETSNAEEAN